MSSDAEFREYFSSLSDGELALRFAEIEELNPSAQSALSSEVSKRSLSAQDLESGRERLSGTIAISCGRSAALHHEQTGAPGGKSTPARLLNLTRPVPVPIPDNRLRIGQQRR
jgi:hypothetical protein